MNGMYLFRVKDNQLISGERENFLLYMDGNGSI